MRRLWVLVIILTSSVALAQKTSAVAQKTKAVSRVEVSKEGQQCLACHSDSTPGIVDQLARQRPCPPEGGLLWLPPRECR